MCFAGVTHPGGRSDVLRRLAADDHLRGREREDFLVGLTELVGNLNALHPFREGNGRTVRAFVAQLARESGLEYDQRNFAQERVDRTGVLTRATLTMSVFGSYANLRRFLYRLETGDDFIVIREVGVMRGDEPNAPLEAALTLSTYFKRPDGR